MKKKLLMLDKHPFGTLTDSYKWCEYLRSDYDITLICLDDDVRLEMEGIKIVRVSKQGSYKVRGSRYILTCLWHLLFFQGIIFVVYFEHCDFLKRFFLWKKMHVDVRTVSVWGDQATRDAFDSRMRTSCLKFDSISVISDGVRERLRFPKAYLLPLGSDVISTAKKNYESLHLLYVGTFANRRIDDTIYGFYKFLMQHEGLNIHYDIIGDGYQGELAKCKEIVKELHLENRVTFHGRLEYQELAPFFDRSNIGVCYVPITPAFNIQPPTKTFEYVMSGLFCIATKTEENKKVISVDNGVLIDDNPQDFCRGLEYVYSNRHCFNELMIRDSLKEYLWETIINNYFKSIIKEF